jgi:ABC-type glycerol-3-phosphate transport system permease component
MTTDTILTAATGSGAGASPGPTGISTTPKTSDTLELGSGNGMNGNRRRSVTRMVVSVAKHIVVLLIAIIMLYPILWMVASSLRPQNEIFTNMGLAVTNPVWENYTAGWNDFFSRLLYLTKPDMYTVPIALRTFIDAQSQSSYGPMFAMSVVSLIPLFLVFTFGQKYLVQGIATTGGK